MTNSQGAPRQAAPGAELIAAERARQTAEEGWTRAHDDAHTDESLARVAALYATPGQYRERTRLRTPRGWPRSWSPCWWKPTPDNRIRELVKAGALIAAEIDRLQRIEDADV